MKLGYLIRVLMWVLILIMTFKMEAASAPDDPGVYLGQSRAKMLSFWGQPAGAYTPRTIKVFPAMKHEALRSYSGTVIDVYSKRFGSNEIGIDVLYSTDFSQSQLHGTERVIKIIYRPDRPQPFSELLTIIPSLRHVCIAGCKLRLSDEHDVLYTASLVPKVVSPRERELAEWTATQLMPLGDPGTFVPTIDIIFAAPPRPLEVVSRATFDKLRVESIDLLAGSSQQISEQSETDRQTELDYAP